MKEALKTILETLKRENEKPNGAIRDTIWHTKHETLFDFIEAALAQLEQEPTGCACRWDSDGDRVVTCARHEGWLEVIAEWADRAREAEKKLKALAQPAQKPVAWSSYEYDGINHKPVAWMDSDGNFSDNNDHKCFPIPLYTITHPTPPQRKPLTDERRKSIAEAAILGHDSSRDAVMWAIQYTERQHDLEGDKT